MRFDVHYHGVRFLTTGYQQIIEVHLLFPHPIPLGEAHRIATAREEHRPVERRASPLVWNRSKILGKAQPADPNSGLLLHH